jgi:tetratricopeptide (TPR) repeat protein
MKTEFGKLTASLVILVVALSTGTVRSELLGQWKFNEGTGNTANDSSFYGNDGILEGNPKWTIGHSGGALEFDGSNWVNFGACHDMISVETITIACWVKPAQLEGIQGLVGLEGGYAFKTIGEGVRFTTPGILDHDSSRIILKVGTWQHVAVTFQPGQGEGLSFYLNGVETERMNSSDMNRGTGPFLIGNNQWTETYAGLIDDVRIYNHVLCSDEIKQLYDSDEALLTPIGHVAQLAEEAERSVKELKPREAVAFIERKIVEYERWRIRNLGRIKSRDARLSSDIYALLATFKEAAGASTQDVTATYKESVLHPHKPSNRIPESLLWLFENIPSDEYVIVVGQCVRNSDDPSRNIYDVTRYFESRKNWAAFKLFLDTVFFEAEDPVSYARVVAEGLGKDVEWSDKFLEYCRDKQELTGYLFRKDDKAAERYIAQKNFSKAANIYRNIIAQCDPRQRKTIYELKLSECLFNDGQYDSTVDLIDSFLGKSKLIDRSIIRRAIMLKGQAYVRLGDIARGADEFLVLMIEHPKAKEAPEAAFFVGYCYMLQGKFNEPTEAFNVVVNDYQESNFAEKARSYLTRIKNMTE